jgi:hypothetical protein
MVPFLRHATLERFTFNLGAKNTLTAFDANGINTDFEVRTAAAGLNWYPRFAPYTVQAILPFFGLYVRSGYGTAETISGQGARYTVFSIPGYRGGLRYLFRNNVGLRIQASMETLKLERYQVNTFSSDMPESETLVEGKLLIGMSYPY